VFHRLAQSGGLLLVLDDFQWADAGSIELLFHLGRGLPGSRILMVVAYRPEEVALPREGKRHPLAPVLHQLRREYGGVDVNLDQAGGRQFLEAFLDSQPNRLGGDFRDRLYAQTGGHPLFTIELLRGMEERGDLVQDRAGQWAEGPALDWRALPARTEAVIAERIGRLAAPLQEALRVASVAGEEFVAEAVARVQGMDEGMLLRRLSGELGRQHRLVAACGIERIDGQHLSLYRFRHILYQQYLYEGLDEVERARLHGQVGRALEALYGGHPDALAEITPQLAHHFQLAGLDDRAVVYLHQAGERALRMWANEEAVRHLTTGLALLLTQPETPERHKQELSMQLALAIPLAAIKGYAAPETGRAYARARELALQADVGEPGQQMQVLGMLAGYYSMRAEYQTALELYERTEAMARRLGHRALAAAARAGVSNVLTMTGKFSQALPHLKEIIDLYDPAQHRSLAWLIGQDIGSSAHALAAWVLWFLGYADQALAHSQEALSLARASEHPFSLCFVCSSAGLRFQLLRGEPAQARNHLEAVSSLAAAGRFPLFEAGATIYGGWLLAEQGQAEAGIAQIREGMAAWEKTGTQTDKPYHLWLLADACGRAGWASEGLERIAEALDVVERTEERFYEAELHRLRGQLLAQSGTAGEDEVAASYRRALELARAQGARSLELRAATSLARLWQKQDQVHQAQQMLAPIYSWFSEGFDTPDLKEARALLEELR
jgi:predicted ATPase